MPFRLNWYHLVMLVSGQLIWGEWGGGSGGFRSKDNVLSPGSGPEQLGSRAGLERLESHRGWRGWRGWVDYKFTLGHPEGLSARWGNLEVSSLPHTL